MRRLDPWNRRGTPRGRFRESGRNLSAAGELGPGALPIAGSPSLLVGPKWRRVPAASRTTADRHSPSPERTARTSPVRLSAWLCPRVRGRTVMSRARARARGTDRQFRWTIKTCPRPLPSADSALTGSCACARASLGPRARTDAADTNPRFLRERARARARRETGPIRRPETPAETAVFPDETGGETSAGNGLGKPGCPKTPGLPGPARRGAGPTARRPPKANPDAEGDPRPACGQQPSRPAEAGHRSAR